MKFMIIDTANKMKIVKDSAMSISNESQLEWIGMNDEGVRTFEADVDINNPLDTCFV